MMHDLLRGSWRLVQSGRSIRLAGAARFPRSALRFFTDWCKFRGLGGKADFSDIAPQYSGLARDAQSGGGHYFYQDVWALRRLSRFKPSEHHDIGSRLDGFVAQATAICPIVYWDIRPPKFNIPNFHFREGNILNLPLSDESIRSLSCLHVVEHIGLGRYGDELDPDGADKALRELERILQPGGQLLFAIPVGKERTEFNAHRVWSPLRALEKFGRLKLKEFSIVTDDDRFIESVNPADFSTQKFSCGLYVFTK